MVIIDGRIGKHFLSILVVGFAILVVLLGVATYIAVGVMYPAEVRALERADQERIAAEHVEAMHRDADLLNTIFYKLAAPASGSNTAELLHQLELVERNLAG